MHFISGSVRNTLRVCLYVQKAAQGLKIAMP